jgi:hypothetical protein
VETWLPVIAAVVGAAVLVVGLDVWGTRRRLLPGGHVFLAALPRSMRRLWALTLTVIVLEVVLTAALFDKGPDWWSFATQVWTVSAPLVGLCLLVILVSGTFASATRRRSAERDRAPEPPAATPATPARPVAPAAPVEPATRVDLASAIGAASGRAVRSSPTARALVGRGGRLLRAARAGLDAAMTDERPPDQR